MVPGFKKAPEKFPGLSRENLLLAVQRLHPLLVVQDALAHPQALGGDLQRECGVL